MSFKRLRERAREDKSMTRQEFTQYVKEYKGLVRGAILDVLPSLSFDDTLDELEQDTWLRAWERRGTYDPDKSQIQTWLHTIAASVAVDWAREQAATKRPTLVFQHQLPVAVDDDDCEVPYYENADPPYHPSAEDEAVALEERNAILARIGKLSLAEQRILSLKYEKGMTSQEIADKLSVSSAAAVRKIIERTKKYVTNGVSLRIT